MVCKFQSMTGHAAKATFGRFDRNGDGKISEEELVSVMSSSPAATFRPLHECEALLCWGKLPLLRLCDCPDCFRMDANSS